MGLDYVYLGSTPADEDCAQTVHENYYQMAKLECEAYQKAIITKLGEPPEGARFVVKENELCVAYDEGNAKAANYAFNCEDNGPKTWAEVNMSAPRMDDPEFTKTDLIAVPAGKAMTWLSEPPTECDMKHDLVVRCKNRITNLFFDARTKQGPWGNICSQCFARYGVGLGTGKGQEYRKATDQRWYKTQG